MRLLSLVHLAFFMPSFAFYSHQNVPNPVISSDYGVAFRAGPLTSACAHAYNSYLCDGSTFLIHPVSWESSWYGEMGGCLYAVAEKVKVYCHDSVWRTEVHLSVFRLDILWHTCVSEVVIILCQPDCVCVLEFAIRAYLYFHNIWTLLCFSARYNVPTCSGIAFVAS